MTDKTFWDKCYSVAKSWYNSECSGDPDPHADEKDLANRIFRFIKKRNYKAKLRGD